MKKEKTFTYMGEPFHVTIDDERIEAKRKEQEARELALRIEDNRRACFSDRTLKGFSFSVDDCKNTTLTSKARHYVENFQECFNRGIGYLFYGSVGTGKSFMAACIANELLDRGYSCFMTTFARIFNEYQETWEKQSYIRRLMQYDLLIIDDLAMERDTSTMNEIVFNVIDERNRCRKPLIVTTNLTGDELKHPADVSKSRIYSRLFEMCIPFHVTGNDRRKEKLAAMLKQVDSDS